MGKPRNNSQRRKSQSKIYIVKSMTPPEQLSESLGPKGKENQTDDIAPQDPEVDNIPLPPESLTQTKTTEIKTVIQTRIAESEDGIATSSLAETLTLMTTKVIFSRSNSPNRSKPPLVDITPLSLFEPPQVFPTSEEIMIMQQQDNLTIKEEEDKQNLRVSKPLLHPILIENLTLRVSLRF